MNTPCILQPITDDDRAKFMQMAPALLNVASLDDLNIEEVDEHWQVSYATGDVGNASAALPKQVSVDISANKIVTVQTQDPLLNGSANNAGDQLIGMYGLCAKLYRGALSLANFRDTLLDLQQTIVVLKNANNRRQEIHADTFIHAGIDILPDGQAVPIGQGTVGVWKMRKFGAPFTVGKEQKFEFTHFIGRTSAWGAAFTLDFYAPCLIARKK